MSCQPDRKGYLQIKRSVLKQYQVSFNVSNGWRAFCGHESWLEGYLDSFWHMSYFQERCWKESQANSQSKCRSAHWNWHYMKVLVSTSVNKVAPGLPRELLEKLRSVQEFSSHSHIPPIPHHVAGLPNTLYWLHSSCHVEFIFNPLMVSVENSTPL